MKNQVIAELLYTMPNLKILCTFPLFADAMPAEQSYDSFNVPNVDIYCINDNAKPDVLELIKRRKLPIRKTNKVDQFATGCWNQTYRYFMKHPEYDCLRIGFTDVVMQEGWKEILEANWSEDEAILPYFTDSLERLSTVGTDAVLGQKDIRPNGTPADCVFLSRKLVELSFPVPEKIKLWYNDEYIFSIMRELGYPTVVLNNLRAYHYGSCILQGPYVGESHARIEIDKANWQDSVREGMIGKINKLKRDGLSRY